MNYDEMTIDELGKELINTVKSKYKAEEVVTTINKQIGALSSILADKMEEKDVKMIMVEDHKLEYKLDETFSIDKDITDSGWQDDDGAFFKWLTEIGEQGLIKSKPSVHDATRKKFLKEYRESGKSLPEFIKIGFFKRVKFNASAVKKEALSSD